MLFPEENLYVKAFSRSRPQPCIHLKSILTRVVCWVKTLRLRARLFNAAPNGSEETRRPGSNLCRQLRHKIGEGERVWIGGLAPLRLGVIVSNLHVSVSISHCRFPGYAWHHRSMMTFTAPHSNFILATVADRRCRVDCAIGGG